MLRRTHGHHRDVRTLAPAARAAARTCPDRDPYASTAPNVAAPLLRRLLGQRLQERQLGTLPALVVRELKRVLTQGAGIPAAPQPVTRTLTPGARLIREWQGRTIAVLVTEDGFLFEERAYRSLSQIARLVTGAHWSGPRFFGITRRG